MKLFVPPFPPPHLSHSIHSVVSRCMLYVMVPCDSCDDDDIITSHLFFFFGGSYIIFLAMSLGEKTLCSPKEVRKEEVDEKKVEPFDN